MVLSISRRTFSTTIRRMAKEYVAIVYDKPGTYAKRMEVRAKHLEAAHKVRKEGIVTSGGGIAENFPAEGQPPALKGSVMTVLADSPEEVREFLKKDIYATEGVWDVDNAQIFAYFVAFRDAK